MKIKSPDCHAYSMTSAGVHPAMDIITGTAPGTDMDMGMDMGTDMGMDTAHLTDMDIMAMMKRTEKSYLS